MIRRLLTNNKTQMLLFAAIVFTGFSLRLSYIHTPGHGPDMQSFIRWARLVTRNGLGFVYRQTSSSYPPLGTALMFPVGLMCPQCAMKAAPTIGERLILRLLGSGFDVLVAAFLFRLGKEGCRAWSGLCAAALYFLSPTMIWISGWWGQSDSWFLFPSLVAGFFLARERPIPAWIFLALSVSIKLQAIILIPVFTAGTWRWLGWRRLAGGIAAFLLMLGLVCAPLLIDGQLDNLISGITKPILTWTAEEGRITLGGHNFWAGFALLKRVNAWDSYMRPNLMVIPGITIYAVGTSVFLLGIALTAAQVAISSNPSFTLAAAALSWMFFFQFEIGVGARYLLPTAVLLLAASLESAVWWVPSIGWHMAAFFNLLDTLQLTQQRPWGLHHVSGQFPLPSGIAANVVLTMTFSLISMGIFFARVRCQTLGSKCFQANRLERMLVGAGYATLVIALAIWLRQGWLNQYPVEQASIALVDSMREQPDDLSDTLVINWPRKIQSPRDSQHTGFPSPPTGILLPTLEEMGMISATTVIFPPWTRMMDQIHAWATEYDGDYVTSAQLTEQILRAKQVLVPDMITNTPQVWCIARVSDIDTSITPVVRFGQQVQLIDAHMEHHDQIVSVHLGWNVTQPLSDEITIFVHILGPNGQLVTQIDGDTVNNLVPVGRWHLHADKVLRETRPVALPKDAPLGTYTAKVGLYNRSTSERMPVSCENERCANGAYTLEPIQISELSLVPDHCSADEIHPRRMSDDMKYLILRKIFAFFWRCSTFFRPSSLNCQR